MKSENEQEFRIGKLADAGRKHVQHFEVEYSEYLALLAELRRPSNEP